MALIIIINTVIHAGVHHFHSFGHALIIIKHIKLIWLYVYVSICYLMRYFKNITPSQFKVECDKIACSDENSTFPSILIEDYRYAFEVLISTFENSRDFILTSVILYQYMYKIMTTIQANFWQCVDININPCVILVISFLHVLPWICIDIKSWLRLKQFSGLRIIYPNYIFSVDYQAEKGMRIVYKYVLYTPEYGKYFFTWNVGSWETSLSTVQCVLSAWRSALLSARRLALFFALGFGSLLLILRMSLLKLLNVHMKNINTL